MSRATASSRRSLADRREQLLDAAIEVMSANGISGATTRAITEQAGVPHGVFHYCFDSKAALLRALLTRESERVLSTFWQLDPASNGLPEALTSSVRAHLAHVRAEPHQFQVLAELTVLARTDPILTDLAVAERGQYADLIAQLLARWLEDTPPADLRRWAVVILAGIDGLIDGWLTTRDDDTIDAAASLFAATVGAALQSTR